MNAVRHETVWLAVTVAALLALFATTLFGAFHGWLIARFNIQPIMATLVLFIAGRGITQVMSNGNLQVFKVPEFQFIGLGRVFGIPAQAILMVIIVIAAGFILRRTVFGQQLLTIGGNDWTAVLAGVPVVRVKIAV